MSKPDPSGITLRPHTLPPPIQASVDATKTEYRRLGTSGLKVSLPILGVMGMGSSSWQDWVLDPSAAIPLLKAAYDRGLNTWDTANFYSNGASEAVIAATLAQHAIPRHKVVIMTKCFAPVCEQPDIFIPPFFAAMADAKDYVNQRGLSRSAIFAAVDASLRRLNTDYIDVLQITRFDDSTPIEETMETLHDLVRAGKVRYLGASSMWTFQLAMMQGVAERRGWTKFVSMQNHYSLLYREEEREMSRFCDATGVGLVPWSPLCRGHLARPRSTRGTSLRSAGEVGRGALPIFALGTGQPDEAIIDRVQEIAEKKGWTMAQVALAWLNARVTSPIVGCGSVERMEEAIGSRGKRLTEEEEARLEELYVPKVVMGHA